MGRRSLVLFAALALSPAAPAAAAETLKPLRTIVYDVTSSANVSRREQTSGFINNPNGTMGSVTSGSGAVDRRFTSDNSGRLTLAIVAAPPDGNLVADVTFHGKTGVQPVVRVVIFDNGTLSYDPKTPLSTEAIRLLPFIARGLVAERDVSPGSSWSVTAPPPAVGTTTYRVLHVADTRATIEVDGSIVYKGAAGFAEQQHGITTYATDVLAPISLDITTRTRRDVSAEQSDTTDSHFLAILVSDSFQKR